MAETEQRTGRKGTGLWVTAFLLVVLVLYPASGGPIHWYLGRYGFSSTSDKWINCAYAPIIFFTTHGPDWLTMPYLKFCTMFFKAGQSARTP